jgi:translation initiation factor IF-2
MDRTRPRRDQRPEVARVRPLPGEAIEPTRGTTGGPRRPEGRPIDARRRPRGGKPMDAPMPQGIGRDGGGRRDGGQNPGRGSREGRNPSHHAQPPPRHVSYGTKAHGSESRPMRGRKIARMAQGCLEGPRKERESARRAPGRRKPIGIARHPVPGGRQDAERAERNPSPLCGRRTTNLEAPRNSKRGP